MAVSDAKFELIFVPFPGMGHLSSMIELAKLLVDREDRLSITFLVMNNPFDPNQVSKYIDSHAQSGSKRIRFVDLEFQPEPPKAETLESFFTRYVESHKSQVRNFVSELNSSGLVRVAGMAVDMFCTQMMDVASEFNLPTYIYYTSAASFLGLMLHLQVLLDHIGQDYTELKDTEAELSVPSFTSPVPVKFLPSGTVDKENGGLEILLDLVKQFREAKGILVNTFSELEPHAISSFLEQCVERIPPIYPVGPIINLTEGARHADIVDWLDIQPDSSVVFLCFGSAVTFELKQVKEIAIALERSGYRFLWSLRPKPLNDRYMSVDDVSLEELLPEGYLERTSGVGKIIGWAPQVEILSHPSIGAFVSHCGWNSTLESLWFGVPMVTWPIQGDQQVNAFFLTRELGLSTELTLCYKNEFEKTLGSEDIEKGIKKAMEKSRESIKEMRGRAREAVAEGGSSYVSIRHFLNVVLAHMHEERA